VPPSAHRLRVGPAIYASRFATKALAPAGSAPTRPELETKKKKPRTLWRDDQDFEDAARLLEAILASSPGLTREELWARLEHFLPAAERFKPSYALEDLWQSKS
jgi:hypothetical protein